MQSREYTSEEVKQQFIEHVRGLVNYWDRESIVQTQSERLQGLAFSILVAIDGCSTSLPAFVLAPSPHEDDKQYAIDNGDNYYPQNNELDIKCDISGDLHDSFYKL